MMHNRVLCAGVFLICLNSYVQARRFSQDFIDAFKQTRSSKKSKKREFNLYRTCSQGITAVALIYVSYSIYSLVKSTNQPSFMKLYILPTWLSHNNDNFWILIGSIVIGIKTYSYKTIAQILLDLTVGIANRVKMHTENNLTGHPRVGGDPGSNHFLSTNSMLCSCVDLSASRYRQ
jgi:amino acid transporter